MSLIRFQEDDQRGPSVPLWLNIVDWVYGSLSTALGQRDFEDFAPYLAAAVGDATQAAGTQVSGSTGVAVAHETDRFGRVRISATAGTNAQCALARAIWFDLQNSPVTVVEARIEQNADANSPQAFVGFTDAAAPDDVFASGVIASGSNQDAIGLLWNADETIDIVAVDDGTLTVLKNDIGVTLDRGDGAANLGLRIELATPTTYRLTPSVNGNIARSGIVNVLATVLPENVMRPAVATTVAATTAPSLDIDWIFTADK